MRILALIFSVLWSNAALAYRPFNGTDADLAAPQEWELEIGAIGYLQQADWTGIVSPALIANYGLGRDLELVLEGKELFLIDSPPGETRVQVLDTALSLKAVIREGTLQESTGPSVALELSALLPESGRTTPGAELAAIVSQRWHSLTVHVNGAASLTREQKLGLFGSLILEGPFAWPIRPVSEGFIAEDVHGMSEISGLVGAIWSVKRGLSVDAGFRMSRVNEGPATFRGTEVRAGLTWAFSIG